MAYDTTDAVESETEDGKKGAPSEDLAELHKQALADFELCQSADEHNRVAALAAIKFWRLGEQWSDTIKNKREAEQRPCMTFNRGPTFIRQVVNEARQNKPAIKVHPADDKADPKTAEVINGLLRNIEYASKSDVAYDTGIDCSATGGFGYWRVNAQYAHDDSFDKDLVINPIENQFTVYGDYNCTGADSADWNICFVTDSMTKKAFEKKYKGKDAVNWESDAYKSMNQNWCSGERITVAEYWRRKEVKTKICLLSNGIVVERDWLDEDVPDMAGMTNEMLTQSEGVTVEEERESRSYEVTQYIMSGAEILQTNEWPGKYIPIIPTYGEVINVEGKRYTLGLMAHGVDAQLNFNYWRTTSTELVALAPKTPWVGAVGQFATDAEKWASANTQTHASLEYDMVVDETSQQMAPAPQRQPFAGVPAGALQEAMNAADDLKSTVGMFDAALGARSNETSGVAINSRKSESDTGTFHILDNQARAIRHTGVILIDLIPHFYNKARVIRVMGVDKTPQNVPINQPLQGQAGQGEDGIEQIYNFTVGKYDLTVDTGPSFQTRREESSAGMTELMRAMPQTAIVIGPHLAKAQDWPGAEEIGQELAALAPKPAGQDPAVQQLGQQLQEQGQQLQQKDQQLKDKNAEYQLEARKVEIDAFKAETERMKVLAPAFGPEQVQAVVMQTLQEVLKTQTPPAAPPQPMPQPAPAMPPQGQQQPPGPPQGGFQSPDQGQMQ